MNGAIASNLETYGRKTRRIRKIKVLVDESPEKPDSISYDNIRKTVFRSIRFIS